MSSGGLRILLFAPVAVYGGYLGAGLSVGSWRSLRQSRRATSGATNVVKNLLSGLTSFVAVLVFVVQGMVAWPPPWS